MYLRTDQTKRSFRDVRAHLTEVCNAPRATLILDFHRPRAILVPIKLENPHNPGPKDKGLARARRDFLAALELLRTH